MTDRQKPTEYWPHSYGTMMPYQGDVTSGPWYLKDEVDAYYGDLLRRERTCTWTLSDDGLAEYITPHGDRVPSSHVLGFRRYTNCPYCGGRIEVTE